MPYDKPRRSGRISKQVPITLFVSDATGRVFTEETHTVVLSLHGAGIVSRHKLLAEQEMTLRSMESNREADIRVVGEIGSQGKLHTYGVAVRDEQLDFWQVTFPPPPTEEEPPRPLALECSGCHSPLTIERGDFEFDVCTIHGGLVRYCDECAFATVWKFPATSSGTDLAPAESTASNFTPSKPTHLIEPAESSVAVMERPSTQTPLANAIVLESLADTLSSLSSERRLHGRAKVNYHACIRSKAFGDDIVACLDMSRGGLSFKTRKAYLLHTVVRVAVPFSREFPEVPAIFVPAKIVTLAKLPGSDFFRCGASFFKNKS
jgi:hypothetical protein